MTELAGGRRERAPRRALPVLSGAGRPGGVALALEHTPDRDGTAAVLAGLARLGWSATFFLRAGDVRGQPALARRLADEGHEVALAGDPRVGHVLGTGASARELQQAHEVVTDATGSAPHWYRPAYGVLSARTVSAAGRLGMWPVLGTARGPAARGGGPVVVVRAVLQDLRDGGCVVLRADQPAAGAVTAACLPVLAQALATHGWPVRRLDDHLGGP